MSKKLRMFDDIVWQKVSKENKNILDDYILELKSRKKSKGTIYQYNADLKGFFCWAYNNVGEDKSILDFKKRDFRKFFLFMEEKSPSRINRMQCSIRNLLQFCTEDDDEYEDYEINIMRNIKGLQKEKVREIYFLTNEQIEQLLNYLIKHKEYQKALYLSISYESCARRNEVHQVLKTDFLENSRTNIVKGKRGKTFQLIYSNKSKEIAKKYFEQRGKDDIESMWVVGKDDNKRIASYETLYNWVLYFRDIIKEITKEDIEFNPHSLRHSGLENYGNGTHYFLKDIGKDKLDIKVLKSIANHSDISTTEGYLKDKDEQLLNDTFGF